MVTGSDSHVWEKGKFGSSFSTWWDRGIPGGSGTVSDPAVVSWGNGRLDVVVRRGSTLYIKSWADGSPWTAWQSLGAPASTPSSAPAISSWGPNRLDVFVRGADNKLYWRKCSANCVGNAGTWSAWTQIPGGTFRGKPTAVSRSAGVIDVFVHALDGTLWGVINYDDSWTSYYLANGSLSIKWDPNCPDCSSPAVMARGPLSLDIVVRGLDNQMLMTSWASPATTWSSYKPLGGVLTSSPTGTSTVRTTDRIDLFGVMSEERQAGTVVYGPWWKQQTE
jgi:hypothetical protein